MSLELALSLSLRNRRSLLQTVVGDGGFLPGEIIDDGGFEEPPIVISVGGAIQFRGKKASGASGKFVYDIGEAAASTVYTMRYDPNWTALANGGATAMVGFGLKSGNDFHLAGTKGDGSGGGLLAYKVFGANLWNRTSGFTEASGGAALGSQSVDPKWAQLEVSSDGVTYTYRTSLDGVTWTDEFTESAPTPFSLLTGVPVFGIAVFLEAADAGSFTVDITLWTVTAAAAAERDFFIGGLMPTYINSTSETRIAASDAGFIQGF